MNQRKNNLPFFDRIIRFFAISRNKNWPECANKNQEKILAEILRRNEGTSFGKEYIIKSIKNYSEFQASVPIFSYEKIFPYIKRMIAGEQNVLTSHKVSEYAKSSGTTSGRSKFIPTPRAFMKENHFKAGRDMVTAYAHSHPNTKIFSGKTIGIAGSIAPIPESNAYAGDISALMVNAFPWWASYTRPYSLEIALGVSWPHKAKEIATASQNADIVSLYGTPTWMLEILEIAQKNSGAASLRDLWPNLEVFFHGAISFNPYRKTYETLVGNPPIEFREVYNASEGVFAFEDEPVTHPGELLLCTNHAIFYEFVEVIDCAPIGNAIALKDVAEGVPYAMLITTMGGLWRYMIGDVVIFQNTKPYRLKIIGRTTQFMNAFGEEVIAHNAVQAIEEAAIATDSEVYAFTAAPSFDAKPAQGAHEWIIEFRTEPKKGTNFAQALDESLRKINSDYDAKRTEDIILGPPILHIAPSGSFRKYLEEKGKLGGQNKIPLLSNDRENLEAIKNMF